MARFQLLWTRAAALMYDFILSAEVLAAAGADLWRTGQTHRVPLWVWWEKKESYIPSGSYFLCMWLHLYVFCFIRSFMSWVMQAAMRTVWSHISSAREGAWWWWWWRRWCVGVQLEFLIFSCSSSSLLREKKMSLNGSLLRLGCESKNENTSTRSGGNQLRREESCRLWHSVSLPPSPPHTQPSPPSPRQLECGRLFL